MMSLNLPTCQYLPLETTPTLSPQTGLNPSYNFSKWLDRHPFASGLEDSRPFLHQNKLHISIGRKTIAEGFTISDPHAVDESAVRDAEAAVMMLFELDPGWKVNKPAYDLYCEVEGGSKLQKNWMPLSDGDELLYVTRLSPLTVVK